MHVPVVLNLDRVPGSYNEKANNRDINDKHDGNGDAYEY